MSENSTPLFQHDCEACKFLGRHKGEDLYFCHQGGLPTVIARWSNSGPDYISGMPPAKHDVCLAEASRRATEAGLL
jgi:hypothetical protein